MVVVVVVVVMTTYMVIIFKTKPWGEVWEWTFPFPQIFLNIIFEEKL